MHPPCKNPNCNSVGKPHPNCRCYGDMAAGGEVSHFCTQDRAHDSQCQYFVEGGEAINPDDVVLDSAPAPTATPTPTPAPQAEINPDEVTLDPEIDPSEVTLDEPGSEKYAGVGQTIKAGLEGASQGGAGFLAPLAETQLGIATPEDIAGRAKAHPYVHDAAEAAALGASMLLGTGEAKAIASVAEHFVPIAHEGAKIGAKILNGIMQGVSFAGSDEITKTLLGQHDGNPTDATAAALLHMTATGLINGATHGLFHIVGNEMTDKVAQKIAAKAEKFLSDIADDGKPVSKALTKAADAGAALYTGAHVAHAGGILGGLSAGTTTYGALKKFVAPWVEKIIDKPLSKANEYVTDAIISSLLKENVHSIPTAMRWGQALTKGAKSYLPGIESLFKAGSTQIAPKVADEIHQELKNNVEEGTPQLQMENQIHTDSAGPQTFAHGGKVEPAPMHEPDHFGTQFPEQNVLLNQAKGRIYGYLNSLRPLPNPMKAPFDKAPPDRDKHRDYNKAIGLAVNPLKILDQVNNGSLTPDDMKHFTALYPEVYGLLSKKMTERMMKAQLSGERPPFKKRQAMSLFLGSALDGCLTPQAIQTAQGVFAKKQAQQPQPSQTKGKALTKSSDAYKTGSQSRQERQQKA